ncbi:helix-turn-helix transcriptional regulator [Stappia indica]|uniref:WYL domain-containing protein n=1 Tax=Stappia indica TaxID=538381 RepID=A0A857C4G0_9HYPH|nr:YafY family protein [Stappia indica]QGZ33843.1 WYL domain-containing protein [Stappia indica]
MKVFRLFSLLDRLRSAGGPVSAEALARALEVSPRTIYRDMATLQAMGAPVRGEAGLGYQMERGYFLPPLSFDEEELEAIALGMRLVGARGDAPLGEAALRVAGKIGAAAGEAGGEATLRLPLRAVTREHPQVEAARHWLPGLRRAIRRQRIVLLAYRDLAGRESRRRVRPLGLTVFDEVWLLTGWCEERGDFRNFRLDRIMSVEETGERAPSERGRRFEDYVASL